MDTRRTIVRRVMPPLPFGVLAVLFGIAVAAAVIAGGARPDAARTALAQDGAEAGSVAAGQWLYAAACAACHGTDLRGTDAAPRLNGRLAFATMTTAADLYTFIQARMPLLAPQPLSDAETLSAVAFLLNQRGLWPEDAVLPAEALAAINLHAE